jgi:hypothetical protein
MGDHVSTLLGGLDHEDEAFRDLLLAEEVLELTRAQGEIESRLRSFDGPGVERVTHGNAWDGAKVDTRTGAGQIGSFGNEI